MELDMALNKLKQQGMQSLILDVRQNPGGLLTTGGRSARSVHRGRCAGFDARTGTEPESDASRPTRRARWNLPIVLLIDENSASASEIVAGAFRDHRRAKIVGRKSYGKWSVQSIYDNDLAYGCGIRMTTAKFYSPNGDTLGKIGVKPDIEIPADQAAPHIIGEVDPVARRRCPHGHRATQKGRVHQAMSDEVPVLRLDWLREGQGIPPTVKWSFRGEEASSRWRLARETGEVFVCDESSTLYRLTARGKIAAVTAPQGTVPELRLRATTANWGYGVSGDRQVLRFDRNLQIEWEYETQRGHFQSLRPRRSAIMWLSPQADASNIDPQ